MNKLYRWTDINWILDFLKNKIEFVNLTNSFAFAWDYWDIICEFEIEDNLNLIKENIKDRKENIKEYDKLIIENNIDWYLWDIGDWVYHYRIKSDKIKLINISYIWEYKNSLANFCILNRKYAWLSQEKLASKLGTKKPNISKYEHWINVPDIKRLASFTSLNSVNQSIDIDWRNIVFR